MNGGVGPSKSVHNAYRGGGVDPSMNVHKKSLFACVFDIFSYVRYFCHTLLSLALTFITVIYGIIDWIFKKVLIRTGGGGRSER